MKEKIISLNKLAIGSSGLVKQLTAQGNIRRRLLDLGITKDTIIESLRKSPKGDPIAFQIRSAVIALRSEESSKILVQWIE
ncbi:MAG TPA: ferrous iron transport protein A [Eubacteriaceae bacterium]|nr:ferrous iron transport protein A [Eubacteriaceae bacterium]